MFIFKVVIFKKWSFTTDALGILKPRIPTQQSQTHFYNSQNSLFGGIVPREHTCLEVTNLNAYCQNKTKISAIKNVLPILSTHPNAGAEMGL